MATKDHPKHQQLGVKHPSGLAPSILCMLAHFHGLLALPGCLKWTILPPTKANFMMIMMMLTIDSEYGAESEQQQAACCRLLGRSEI